MEFNTTTIAWSNTTTAPVTNSTLPSYVGFLFLMGSSFFYGSNYLPVKQYETGDGMFFQLILCMAIWSVGFVVNWIRDFPKFYALPMLGGFLWATGNANTVPIIKTIGIGLGMLFWNAVGLITGWATARFGLFGLSKEVPSNVILNYLGVVFALLSTIFYLFVQTETGSIDNNGSDDAEQPSESTALLRDHIIREPSTSVNNDENPTGEDFFSRLNPSLKKIVGVTLSIISGIMYGQSNTPVLLAREKYEDTANKNYLDFLLSFYTGIFTTSLLYFVIYCIAKKNKPVVFPQVILPGIISGWMWGIANVCFFMATNALSQAISYPISATGPPIVASCWGIFLYKEIKGRRNFAFLLTGFAVAIVGSVLTGLSF